MADLPLITLLFSQTSLSIAETGVSSFRHSFGGVCRRLMSRSDGLGEHLRLLHRFDLTDPAIPFRHGQCRWLPIYRCIDSRCGEIGYQFLTDDAPVRFFLPHCLFDPPTEQTVLPYHRLIVDETEVTATDIDDVLDFGGVFGDRSLSAANRSKLIDRLRVLLDEEIYVDEATEAELLHYGLNGPFLQGRPSETCVNPDCSNRIKGNLETLLICSGNPVKGVHIFGEFCDHQQLIVMRCPECGTIVVSGQFT